MLLALIATLTFTHAATGQRVWTEPSADGDSVHVECDGGPAIHSLQSTELWWYPVTGGGYRKLLTQDARGKEGLADAITFDQGPGGHAYLIEVNNAGRSCASNEVYVPGFTTTGIDGTEVEQVVYTRCFDVHGKLVDKPRASGVYFWKSYWKSGRTTVKREVYIK